MNTPWSQTAAQAIALADLLSEAGFPVLLVTADDIRAPYLDERAAQVARKFAAEMGAPIVTGEVSYVFAYREQSFTVDGISVRWEERITVTVSEQVPA